MSSSMPSKFDRLSLLFTVNEWFHAMVVEGVRFDQVDDVEFVSYVFTCVRDAEKEPLGKLGRMTSTDANLGCILKLLKSKMNQ